MDAACATPPSICAHRLLNPDALSSVRAQRAFERAMRLGARAALVAGNHR